MREIFDIFIIFFKLGFITFGGGYSILPLMHTEIVQKRGFLSEKELTDYYALAQCLPGMIAINTAMLTGYKQKGYAGLVSAALGIALPSFIIIIILSSSIQLLVNAAVVQNIFNGIRVAVLVLISVAFLKIWKLSVKNYVSIIIFTISSFLIIFLDLSPIAPIILAVLISLLNKRL
jgi:chromate transporter